MEEAWGQGTRFVERRSWAMYFTYTVEEPIQCGGDGSKCVFVTSATYDGELGGLSGADAKCQAHATAEGSLAAPGTYKAWLSDSTASPSTRFTKADVPYRLVDGSQIAADWTDLTTDGDIDTFIDQTEAGSQLAGQSFTRTTTFFNGTAAHDSHECFCDDWHSASPDIANQSFGIPSAKTQGEWTYHSGVYDCNIANTHLYCFQQ